MNSTPLTVVPYESALSASSVDGGPELPLVSVLIPVYNEQHTISELLKRVIEVPIHKEIIVVDDGSSDGTLQALEEFRDIAEIIVLNHSHNRGKGAAVRTALERATGRFCIIQDADLEYDPFEIVAVLQPLLNKESAVVYGSRYLSDTAGRKFRWFRYGVSLLNLVILLLYGIRLTDSATCYKAMSTTLLRSLKLQSCRFEFCPEVTAKLSLIGVAIREIPISYHPRDTATGKKIRWYDGLWAISTLLKWRISGFVR
ncbi:MAG: glycosyltransferase family 2 protein [Fuerstia sp.]|nr:glycosyltransferase family 2 protein [Fuerstiella sp.]